MADPTPLDELLARQRAMADLAASLAGEQDVERIQQVAAQLQVMGAELEALARQIEADTPGAGPAAFAEVVLTEAQRDRVERETGVRLESVRLPDAGGITSRLMPTTDPRIIEYHAMNQARERKYAAEAEELLQAELARALSDIESQGTPAVLDKLAELRADPTFLGGLLQKK